MRTTTIFLILSIALVSCDGKGGGQTDGQRAVAKAGAKYVVEANDTLYGIAQAAYGPKRGNYWRKIQEANPWIREDRLVEGDLISIPEIYLEEYESEGSHYPIEDVGHRPQDNQYVRTPAPPGGHRRARAPQQNGYDYDQGQGGGPQGRGTSTHSNPGNGGKSRSVWNTLRQRVGGKTFFGMTLDKLSFYIVLASIFHAFFQGFVVWITTNISFVKDASLKKSLHATFLTEMLCLCTLALVAAVAVVMAYAGTKDGGASAQAIADSGASLFPSVESFLKTRNGAAMTGMVVLALYVILSLRFIPQVFGIERSQAFTVVFLGVLLPHMIGIYMAGQRLGYL